MSVHGAVAFYRPDKSVDKEYVERMRTYGYGHVEYGGRKRGRRDFDEAAKKLDEERLSMFFVDHVMENDKKQDVALTASILDALCYRVKLQLREAEEVVFISDNARNYNNDLLPILLPKICDSHGLLLRSYMHPDACCGKSCVDGHFAVHWRLLKRYIEETESDVVTPEDIMDALTYDGGVKNTVVDYIKINRSHDTFLNVLLAQQLRMVEHLGTQSEIKYERMGDGRYALRCYKYSGCQYERIIVDGFESGRDRKYINPNEEDKTDPPPAIEQDEIDPKTGKKKTPKGPVMESTILRRRKKFHEQVRLRREGTVVSADALMDEVCEPRNEEGNGNEMVELAEDSDKDDSRDSYCGVNDFYSDMENDGGVESTGVQLLDCARDEFETQAVSTAPETR